VERVKDLESAGWTFEAADASFELLLRDEMSGARLRHFTVESWRTIVEQNADGLVVSEATVKVHAGGERIIAVGEGNGPVNALDNALRAALAGTFPELSSLDLIDYKVRILDGGSGTDAVTRVLVGTTDGTRTWTTVGVHENVIAASWLALEDAIAYGLLKAGRVAGDDAATV
jgi:2-isopropylmalate synthase